MKLSKEAAGIVANAQVGPIRLVECSATTTLAGRDSIPGGAESTISSGARISQLLDGNGQFRVQVRVEAAVTVPQAAPILKVTAAFELTYRLPGGATASEKALEEFASTNAVFNAWPFLREFFVSITQRMDLPPLVLPLIRVGADTKPAKKKRPA